MSLTRDVGKGNLKVITYNEEATGTLLSEFLITGGLTNRLAGLSMNFQMYRFRRLQVHVTSGNSSTAQGVYGVSWVQDPDDMVDPGNVITLGNSCRHSVRSKVWENCTLRLPMPPLWFFTSQGADLRKSSPGKLIVYALTPMDQGSLTVDITYEIEFKNPSLEEPEVVTSGILVKEKLHPAFDAIVIVGGATDLTPALEIPTILEEMLDSGARIITRLSDRSLTLSRQNGDDTFGIACTYQVFVRAEGKITGYITNDPTGQKMGGENGAAINDQFIYPSEVLIPVESLDTQQSSVANFHVLPRSGSTSRRLMCSVRFSKPRRRY